MQTPKGNSDGGEATSVERQRKPAMISKPCAAFCACARADADAETKIRDSRSGREREGEEEMRPEEA